MIWSGGKAALARAAMSGASGRERVVRERVSEWEVERSERAQGGSNSVVESQPSKLLVAGSIPVSRSTFAPAELGRIATEPTQLTLQQADVAQLAEHVLGKDEVTSSILVIGSSRSQR